MVNTVVDALAEHAPGVEVAFIEQAEGGLSPSCDLLVRLPGGALLGFSMDAGIGPRAPHGGYGDVASAIVRSVGVALPHARRLAAGAERTRAMVDGILDGLPDADRLVSVAMTAVDAHGWDGGRVTLRRTSVDCIGSNFAAIRGAIDTLDRRTATRQLTELVEWQRVLRHVQALCATRAADGMIDALTLAALGDDETRKDGLRRLKRNHHVQFADGMRAYWRDGIVRSERMKGGRPRWDEIAGEPLTLQWINDEVFVTGAVLPMSLMMAAVGLRADIVFGHPYIDDTMTINEIHNCDASTPEDPPTVYAQLRLPLWWFDAATGRAWPVELDDSELPT